MFIGITGGVGAGKSTVLEYLKDKHNAYLILADDVAKELMKKGKPAYKEIRKEFGDDILASNKEIDRAKLSQIVFQDEKKLEKLNAIVHPLVRKAVIREKNQVLKEDPERLVVLEAALLIEAGYRDILDELWAVTANKEVRIKRLRENRGYSRKKSESVIANQLSYQEYRAACDFVIYNSGDFEKTAKQLEDYFERNKDR